jgi:thiol-disulfide isomerase/thioredoxin
MSDNQKIEKKDLSKKDKIVTAVIVVLVLFVIGYNLFSYYSASIFLPGKEFSVISGIDPSNNRNKSIDVSKGKTVVNFWATWCSGCVAEINELANASRYVSVVGIMKKPFNKNVFSALRLPYDNLIGEDLVFEEMFVSVLPMTLLVIDGVVKKVHTGPVSEDMVKQWLKDYD